MTVIDKRSSEILFEKINPGQVFEWMGDFYMKTDGDDEAVRLSDGTIESDFGLDVPVYPVNAILTIS